MTSFRDRLKEIRTAKEEEARSRTPLTDEELGINDGTEACLDARNQITRHIEGLMNDFIAETPHFGINRGFFEGKYSISMTADELGVDNRGDPAKVFSRINFLLAPCTSDATIEIISKITVRNRDLPKATTSGDLTSESHMAVLLSFVEKDLIRFAEQYFSGRVASTLPVETS